MGGPRKTPETLVAVGKAVTAYDEKLRRKRRSYDSFCEILAEHFLGPNATTEDVEDLAQQIQEAVEEWLIDRVYAAISEEELNMTPPTAGERA